jgi:2-hydroxy-3-keto-5-methylthiopentenyl-1-phosphate phosphatase
MIDLLSNLTAIIMLIGILVGALISPRVSHKIGTEHSRKDLIFRKKLEYFEHLLEAIETNIRLYKQTIKKIEISESDKELRKLVAELKENRKHFLIMSSPLYFDIRKISEKIIRFVRVEKEIFNRASLIEKSKDRKIALEELKKILILLNKRGNDILLEMRKELAR